MASIRSGIEEKWKIDRYLFKAKTARIVDSFNNAEDGKWVKGERRYNAI